VLRYNQRGYSYRVMMYANPLLFTGLKLYRESTAYLFIIS